MLHVLPVKYPIGFWLTAVFWVAIWVNQNASSQTTVCLVDCSVPFWDRDDIHLLFVRQSSYWKHCVSSSISVYSTCLRNLCFYPNWFIFPLQTLLSPHYEVNLVTAYIIMVLMGIWAFCVAGGSRRSLKLCLLCQDKDFLLYNQRSR